MMNRRLSVIACGLAFWTVLGNTTRGEEKPLAGGVIVVDPGHGGQGYSKSYTGGTLGVVSRLTESELNLRVAFELARLLREDGATVYMTREANHRLSPEGSRREDELHARIDFFDHYNCHFFLSVHHNAGRTASGHTALYKHNADDDTLYEAIATDVNNALEGVVPGPKLKRIKGSYHILRETNIPGTIAESGFMTNKQFDELSNKPEYPSIEAKAIRDGAIKFWTDHKPAILKLHELKAEEWKLRPRDPRTYTAIALNPDFQARMKGLLAKVAPDGNHDPAKVADYIQRFKAEVVTDPAATFAIEGTFDGKQIRLGGSTSDASYHDQLIDLFIAMKLFDLVNEITFPRSP